MNEARRGFSAFNEPLIPDDELAVWKESERAAVRRMARENARLRHELQELRADSTRKASYVRHLEREIAVAKYWKEQRVDSATARR